MQVHHRIADIGCLVRVGDETPMAAIRQAIALAAGYGVPLDVMIGVLTVSTPYAPIWSSMAASVVAEVNAKARQQGDSLAETVRAEAGAAGIEASVQVVAARFADLATAAARLARAVDVVVVDQQHGAFDTSEMLLEAALFHSGRPVLVASPAKPPLAAVRSILVGWDGSAHAARAVADALAMFPDIRAVEIVTVSGEKNLTDILPGADYARHLARKGVEVTLSDVLAEGRAVATVLDERARQSGADLIVTGAFGHSRVREFLLGGVTVGLSAAAGVPVLMAY